MASIHHSQKWLIELLTQSGSIHMRDGLGTFVHKTSYGWHIKGRDDVITLLDKTIFDNLSLALKVAKSLKNKYTKKYSKTWSRSTKDKTNARS